MGKIDTMDEFLRSKLHKQFSGAVALFPAPDFVALSKQDNFDREIFIFKRADRMMGLVRSHNPAHDLFPAEQLAIREMGRLIHEYCAESKEGVSFPILRRMWAREMEGVIGKLVDTAAPIVAGISTRNAAPNPRSA